MGKLLQGAVMISLPFRVLYRVFLLRLVDLELMSADADPARLIGQFATIFASISFFLTLPALIGLMGGGYLPMTFAWTWEHFLIETAATVAGIIVVLNWDAAFPDRRDVLVLGYLPVRMRTLFLAKIAALFAAPALAMSALNVFTGFTWSFLFRSPKAGFIGLLRALPAYWLTMFLAGAFVVFTLLAVQGLAANLLPRQLFLRLSAFLQAGALCLLLLVYFLEPSLESPAALTAPQNQRLLAWLPSYWFLGLFQQLNGSMHPALAPLAARAWLALAISAAGAGAALLLSYFRMLPKIVEQPDIVPMTKKISWLHFGNSLQTAITLFSLRTLLRSRQHRMIASFYLGIGVAVVVACVRTPLAGAGMKASGMNTAVLLAGILLMILAVLAIRVVASFPITLRANWIMRVTQLRQARSYQRAVRLSWILLGVLPVWLIVAASMFALYPWRPVVEHLVMMLLLGAILIEVCLYTFPKIPFACSYLPGKANIHFVFWACFLCVIEMLYKAAKFESRVLHRQTGTLLMMFLVLAVAASVAHWITNARIGPMDELLFEEEYPPEIVSLKLN